MHNIFLCGAVPLILAAMKNHPDHKGVQNNACFAMANLSHNNCIVGKAIVDGNAISLCLEAMRKHPYDKEVQDEACFLMRNLTFLSEENTKLILQEGGIPLIMSAIDRFFDNMHEDVHGLIINLSLNAECYEILLQFNIIETLVNLMRKNENNATILDLDCGALRNMAIHTLDNQKLISLGATKLVIEAMAKFPDQKELQEGSLCYLGNLSYHSG
eukprot:TRINITY_DN2023_c0_g1_i7.p1 TRINITY_DN2023_c0_g1~~TRINITY_DN2023_c0_g1_i7.p1  ORF type:complete len:215 (-),score=26.73 TRINITY_DN2023_c0_g1_i7:49-693(-)